jgi:hypothetical protein
VYNNIFYFLNRNLYCNSAGCSGGEIASTEELSSLRVAPSRVARQELKLVRVLLKT